MEIEMYTCKSLQSKTNIADSSSMQICKCRKQIKRLKQIKKIKEIQKANLCKKTFYNCRLNEFNYY